MKNILPNFILSALVVFCFLTAGQARAAEDNLIAVTLTSVALEQTPTDDGGPCAAAYLMGSDSPELLTLRQFRDGILAKTALGKSLTELYYAKSGSLISLLDSSPALKNYTKKALQAVLPAIKNLLVLN